jgi:NitT/TauT family transport system substrate-binding protein
VLIGATACGGDDEEATGQAAKPDEVSLRLDWVAWPHHAGFYVAEAKGWYEEAGLKVKIGEGEGSGSTAQLVAAGRDTFGFIGPSSMIDAVQKGVPLKMVGGFVQDDGFAMATLADSGITDLKDFEGKTVAPGPPGSTPFSVFPALMEANGVDIDKIKVVNLPPAAEVGALTSGRVDAVEWNTFAAPLFTKHIDPEKDLNLFKFKDHGVTTLGWGVVASHDTLENDEDVVRRFVEASSKGWKYALENPQEAAEIINNAVPDAEANVATTVAMFEVMKDMMHTPRTTDEPLGWMAEEDWQELIDRKQEEKDAGDPPSPSDLFTNEFIPGGQ